MRLRSMAILVLTLLAAPAAAAPLVEPHPGGILFVGPVSPHPSATWWNPAALVGMTGHQLLVQGMSRLDSYSFERARISSATGEPDPAGDLSFAPSSDGVVTPNGGLWFASDLNTALFRLGVALHAPFAERLPDVEDQRYHAAGGSFYTPAFSFAVAVRASGAIALGAGVSVLLPDVDLRFARDVGLEDCPTASCTVEDPDLAEEYRFRGPFLDIKSYKDWGASPALAWHAGVMVRIPRVTGLRIGASYMAAPVAGSAVVQETDVEVRSQALGAPLSGRGRVRLALPQIVRAGARWQLDEELAVSSGFQWTIYSWTDKSVYRVYDLRVSSPELIDRGVPEWMTRWRQLDNVWSLDAGLEWQANRRLQLGAVVRVESSAVPAAQVAADQVDAWKLDVGVGGRVRLSTAVTGGLAYALTAFAPMHVQDSTFSPQAWVTCRDSGYDLDACAPVRDGRARPTAAGETERLTHQVVLDLAFAW